MVRGPLRDSHELCQDLMKPKSGLAEVMSVQINIFETMYRWTMLASLCSE